MRYGMKLRVPEAPIAGRAERANEIYREIVSE